jgi:hypothetical protein
MSSSHTIHSYISRCVKTKRTKIDAASPWYFFHSFITSHVIFRIETPNGKLWARAVCASYTSGMLCHITTALLELLKAISIGKNVIENGIGKLYCVLASAGQSRH